MPTSHRFSRLAGFAATFGLVMAACPALVHAGACPAPVVTSIVPATVPAAGGISLTINGSNFTANGSPKVTIGLRDVQVLSATNTQLVVVAPPQDDEATPAIHVRPGKNKPLRVTLTRFSYEPPVVVSAPPALVPRGGGTVLTVTGSNFRCSAPGAYVEDPATGGTCPAQVVAADDTSIVIRTEDCDDGNTNSDERVLHVTLAREGIVHRDLAARNILLSGSRASSVTPASVPSSGGTVLTIVGSGFAAGSTPPTAQVCVDGRCADARVSSYTDTQVFAVAPPAPVVPSNAQGRVVVTTNGVAGSSCALDYDSTPIIRGSRSSSLPASGGYPLTIRGDNFGPNMLMSCDDGSGSSVVVPTTGVGPGVIVGIVVGSPASTMNVSLLQAGHASAPISLPVLPPPTIGNAFAPANALGGDVLTISGTNFGPASALHDVQVSVRQNGVTTPAGPVRWLAPEALGVRLPAGAAGPADVIVSVNGVSATRTNAITYGGTGNGNAPIASTMLPTSVARGGGTVLTISGSNFGAAPLVRFGTQVLTPNPRGNTFAVVTTPALADMEESVPIEVLANGKESNPLYQGPKTETTNPLAGGQHSAWAGGTLLTITGSDFVAQSRVLVETGSGASTLVTPATVAPNQIRFVSPEVSGPTTVTARVVNGSASSNAQTLDYAGPVITGVSAAALSPAGGDVLTITGSGFGAAKGKTYFETGDIPTQDFWSDDQIVVTTPPRTPGCPSNRPFRVQSAAGQTSTAVTFSYTEPVVDGPDSPATTAIGGYPLTIRGDNFGPTAHLVWADGLPGPDITVTNQTRTSFAILLGSGSSGSRLMSLDSDSQRPPVAFALELLAPPELSGVSPPSGPLAGGNTITIHGANFGPPGTARAAWFAGEDDCPFTITDESPGTLVCTLPPGSSSGLRDLVVAVAGETDTLFAAYEYGGTTGVDDAVHAPRALALAALRSPFASEATLRLSLPQAGRWQLVLHDVRGAQVRRFEGDAPAGALDLRWDGRAGDGHAAAPGVYFARLTANGATRDARLVKLR
ncbi:MAG: IPT/TIG domain-containing protein [Candidatus Eisenbacteria bacterium]